MLLPIEWDAMEGRIQRQNSLKLNAELVCQPTDHK